VCNPGLWEGRLPRRPSNTDGHTCHARCHLCEVTNPGRGKSPLVGAIHELPLPKRHRFATRRVLPRAIHESPLPLNPCRAHRMKWVIKGRKHGPDKQVPPNTDVTSRSLQIGTSKAGPTEAGPAEKDFAKVGRARLSCPVNGNGLSNVEQRTRQAGPFKYGGDKHTLLG